MYNGSRQRKDPVTMEYDNAALLLRYEAHNKSGYDPALQLLIMKQANGVFYRTEKTRRDEGGPDHFLQVSGAATEAVKKILAEDRLYSLEKLEAPKENWGGIHVYDFFFRDGSRSVYYYGAQLEYVAGRKDFPKTNYIIVHPNNVSMPVLGKITPSLGALPIPDELSAYKNFLNAIETRIAEGHSVVVYPEAHIWPYYTKIRNYL